MWVTAGSNATGRAELAAWLGYERAETAPEDRPVESPCATESAVARAPELTPIQPFAPVPFWRAEQYIEATELESEPVAKSEPLDLSAPRLAPPALDALTPWPGILPALWDGLVVSRASGRLDTDKLIERWSRSEWVPRLPRVRRARWPRRLEVWVDRAIRLGPFWDDQDALVRRLEHTCPRGSLRVRYLQDGPPRVKWNAEEADDTRCLALTDLGAYGDAADVSGWSRAAMEQQRFGVGRTALTPVPPSRAAASMASWSVRPWDHRPECADQSAAARGARVEAALLALAPAVRIEAGLVRAARRALGAAADVGTEADLWAHASLATGPTGAAWASDEQKRWRTRYLDPNHLAIKAEMVKALRRHHRGVIADELWDEEVVFLRVAERRLGVSWLDDAERATSHALGARLEATLEAHPEAMARYWRQMVNQRVDVALLSGDSARARLTRRVFEGRPGAMLAAGLAPADVGGHGAARLWRVLQVPGGLSVVPDGSDAASGHSVAGLWGRDRVHVEVMGRWAVERRDGRPVPVVASELAVRTRPPAQPDVSWAKRSGRDRYGLWVEVELGGVPVTFRWIRPGTFLMGSADDEDEVFGNEHPRHRVTLTQGYWLADVPCTQAVWAAVMRRNPSRFKAEDRPVDSVSAEDVEVMLERLNGRRRGMFRLPTEAEWEYACRSGTETPRYGELDEVAWWRDNSGGSTQPVRRKMVNSWGLYDMLGNVSEWCQDSWRRDYGPEPVSDPVSADGGVARVVRGGDWGALAGYVRAASRQSFDVGSKLDGIGFRLARSSTLPHHSVEPDEQGRTKIARRGVSSAEGPEAAGVLLLTDRARLKLAAVVRPPWAAAFGRDRRGLWADLAFGYRLRWVPPGRYTSPLDQTKSLLLKYGFWLGDRVMTPEMWGRALPVPTMIDRVGVPRSPVTILLKYISLPGLLVRLPTMQEWDCARALGIVGSPGPPASLPGMLQDLSGPLGEWCEDGRRSTDERQPTGAIAHVRLAATEE